MNIYSNYLNEKKRERPMTENKKELIKSLIDIGFDVDTISAISQAVDDLVDRIKSIPEFKEFVKESDAETTGEFINEIQEMTKNALHTAVDKVIDYSALKLRNVIKEESYENPETQTEAGK